MTPGVSTTTPAMSTGLAAGRASTRSPRDPQCRGPTHITIAALPLIAEWIQGGGAEAGAGAGAGVEAGPGATTLAAGEIQTADQAIAPRCQTLALFLLLMVMLTK